MHVICTVYIPLKQMANESNINQYILNLSFLMFFSKLVRPILFYEKYSITKTKSINNFNLIDNIIKITIIYKINK